MVKSNIRRRRFSLTCSLLFLCAVLICGLLTPIYAADSEGSDANKYVENISVLSGFGKKVEILNRAFNQEITSYSLSAFDSQAPAINLTVSETALSNKALGYQIKVDGKVPAPVVLYTKAISTKTTQINLGTVARNFKLGPNKVSICVGTKTGNNISNYDEYVFDINYKPALSAMVLSSDGTQIATGFSVDQSYLSNVFTAISDTETASLKLTFNNRSGTVKCYLGSDKTVECASGVESSITFSNYSVGESESANIPITLVYENGADTIENQYFLYIAKGSVAPIIKSQSEDIECEKGETPTLSVAVQAPETCGVLSYQWYSTNTGNEHAMQKIVGATSNTYKIPVQNTNRAAEWLYRCVVTNTVDGHSYSTYGDVIAVNVNLTYVSAPNIVLQTGSFSWSTNGTVIEDYQRNYTAGEKFNALYTCVELPENGVSLDFSYYYSQSADYATGTLMNVRDSAGAEATVNGKRCKIVSVQPEDRFEAGTYYVYCVVTAKAENMPTVSTKSEFVRFQFESIKLDFTGEGTAESPYEISTEEDLNKLRELVNGGQWCSGVQFKMMNDIELSSEWQPIGTRIDLTPDITDESKKQYKIEAFGGIFDGNNHKLTIAEGGKPLFNLVSDAVIKNLDIFGKKINGNGLIDQYFADYGEDGNYWTGVPDCVTLQNVRLLEGSSTLRSGLMEGSGSGANTITIENCVIENGVTIGYDKQQSNIGSFVGSMFNGQINNSYSEADIYGKDVVGGLAGKKGQSMGLCVIRNSHFSGNLVATGNWIGGLIAGGYVSDSAPNTMPVSFINSYVDADITGADYVGGLFGGEEGLESAMNDCYLEDSFFYGKITATGEHVGGIIGWYQGINLYQHIENNYYYETSEKELPLIGGVGKYWYTDEEKEAVIAKMGSAKTAEEFKDGTVKNLLNEGSDYKNWTQGENALYPTLLGASVVTRLDISGTYKTEYYLGEDLDLTGMKITAVYSDGKTVTVDPTDADVTITGYDKNKNEVQKLTISYKGATAEITVKVLKSSNITVYFTLLGDIVHDDGTTHTLADNTLTEWLPRTGYSVDLNATVLDVVQAAFAANNITFVNEKGNYISSVTYNDVTLTEKMNSAEMKSGWMYTLNGVHSGNAVNEQFLNSGDEIIFHWTDDYTKESSIDGDDKPTPTPGSKVTAEELAKAYKDTGDAQALKTPGTGSIEGEWLMLGLARAEHTITTDNRNTYLDAVRSYINARYRDGKLYDAELNTTVSTDNSRIILALTALGEDPQTFVTGKDLLKGYSDFDWVKKQGINGTIWALIALDSNQYEIPTGTTTRDKLISDILDNRTTNGGWATSGDVADADMTAMAIQALAPYYSRANVKTAVNKALNLLSKTQNNETGAYYNSYNELSVESTAQVIVALTSLGINPTKDDRFITNSGLTLLDGLMNFYNGSGEFKHTVNGQGNPMATEQSYYALVSYYRHLDGKTTLYDMSDNGSTPESVESVIEKIREIPDPVDEDSYEAIITAREAYNKLTTSEKQQVPAQYLNKLVNAEADYATLLDEAKTRAKNELTEHYLSFNQEDYGEAGRKKLSEILSTAQKNIASAKTCKQVSTLLDRAIQDMNAVKKGDMTVTFRLIGALTATQDVNLTSDSYLPEYVTWIPTTKYEMASNATVYDLFTEALRDAGLSSTGAENNYVKTIYAPSCLGGYALSEFTNGARSGWMYTVNGSHPSLGLKEQELKDGDMVVWHYVNDYSHEVSDWKSDSQHPSLGNGTYYNGWLRAADITPERYVEQLLGKILTVGKNGTVEPKLTLSHLGKSVTFTFKPDKGYRVKDVKVDGKSVGAVTTYTVDKLTVSTRIEVTFTNGKLPFTDVRESDWFYDDVVFAYENGLFSGTSDTTFSPNTSMTRAMLVTVLYRLEGQPTVNGRSGFSDVTFNSYYEDAVTWAADNGIVNGISSSTFSPNANVTREQMAAILYRYAQYKKYNTAASSSLNSFSDHTSVSGYAVASLQWSVAEKLVNGSNGKLMPTGNATRAQVAAILHRFMENVAATK